MYSQSCVFACLYVCACITFNYIHLTKTIIIIIMLNYSTLVKYMHMHKYVCCLRTHIVSTVLSLYLVSCL